MKTNGKTKEELQEMMSDNWGLAVFFMKKWGNKTQMYLNWEEIESACLFGLFKATATFDETKGFKFGTYAARIINNEIMMEIRKHKNSRMRDVPASGLRLSHLIRNNTEKDFSLIEDSEWFAIEDPTRSEVDNVDFAHWLLDALTDFERNVVEAFYFHGMNQREISELLDTSQSYVSRIIQRSLTKMKKLGKENWIA